MNRLGILLGALSLTLACGGGASGQPVALVTPSQPAVYDKLETWNPTRASLAVSPLVAPDGLTKLSLFKEDSSDGFHTISKQFTIPAGPRRLQFYVKSAGRSAIQLHADNGNIDTQTFFGPGQTSTRNWGAFSASTKVTDLGGGIFRVTLAWNGTVPTAQVLQLQLDDCNTSEYAGDGASGVYLWGLQQADALPSTPIKVATEGDSISATCSGRTWPTLLQPNPGSTVTNHAVSGTTTSDMLTRWQSYKGDGSNWFILLGGINDLNTDAPLETIQANLSQMWNEAKALGYTVVALTTTPHKGDSYGFWTPERQTAQDALNAWIRTYAVAHGLLLVDTWALLVDPANPNTLNPAYDSGDHLHPNLAGSVAIGNGVQALIPQVDQTLPL